MRLAGILDSDFYAPYDPDDHWWLTLWHVTAVADREGVEPCGVLTGTRGEIATLNGQPIFDEGPTWCVRWELDLTWA